MTHPQQWNMLSIVASAIAMLCSSSLLIIATPLAPSLGLPRMGGDAFNEGAVFGAAYYKCVGFFPGAGLRAHVWATQAMAERPDNCAAFQALREWEQRASTLWGQQLEAAVAQPTLQIPRTGEWVSYPATDAEWLRLLEYPDTLLTSTMQGLYHTKRAQGLAMDEAYLATLDAWLDRPTGSKFGKP